MKHATPTLVVVFCLASIGIAETPVPKLALKGLDPVALADGKEVAGLDSIEVTHGLFKYRFANAENKKAFEARPDEKGIQFGGACGKMGPLSGTGSPDRFLIHAGQIYVFASEGCRDGFRKDPEKHIERANPVPKATPEQLKAGERLLNRVLVGFGGADKVDKVKALHIVAKHVYKQGDKEISGIHRTWWAFPGRVRDEEEFSKPNGFVVRPDGGFEFGGNVSWQIAPDVREVAWRLALRHPFVVLKHRSEKGFVAVGVGPGKVGDVGETPVERLDVALSGATSTWSVDPKTGHILQVEYQARRGIVGDNLVKYSDFREANGLWMPHRRAANFNGKEITSPEVRIERIAFDVEIKADLFEPVK